MTPRYTSIQKQSVGVSLTSTPKGLTAIKGSGCSAAVWGRKPIEEFQRLATLMACIHQSCQALGSCCMQRWFAMQCPIYMMFADFRNVTKAPCLLTIQLRYQRYLVALWRADTCEWGCRLSEQTLASDSTLMPSLLVWFVPTVGDQLSMGIQLWEANQKKFTMCQ